MPKERLRTSTGLQKYIVEYGEHVFSVVQEKLYCKPCNKTITHSKPSNVLRHVSTATHKLCVAKCEDPSLQQDVLPSNKTFNEELCAAFISADIPLHKLQDPKLRAFLEKYTGKPIPHPTTLRKYYVRKCYDKCIDCIRMNLNNHNIWVSMDETTDAVGRFVVNVVVGALDAEGPIGPYLLTSDIVCVANYSTISAVFDNAMKILWPSGVQHDRVRLFVTDAATYMVKAGTHLQVTYKNVIHVTCLAHACHRLAEEVRSQFPAADKLIGTVKKVFVKSPSLVAIFRNLYPGVALPPAPVLTRWGTWLEACEYYSMNFDGVKHVVQEFDINAATAIKTAQILLRDPDIKRQLSYITSNFGFLTSAIQSLERSGEELVKQITVMKEVTDKLNSMEDSVGKRIAAKLQTLLQKNKGYHKLRKIANVIKDESSASKCPDIDRKCVTYFTYAPVVSADVERSFSAYKSVLSDRRQSFSFENLKMWVVIHCNK